MGAFRIPSGNGTAPRRRGDAPLRGGFRPAVFGRAAPGAKFAGGCKEEMSSASRVRMRTLTVGSRERRLSLPGPKTRFPMRGKYSGGNILFRRWNHTFRENIRCRAEMYLGPQLRTILTGTSSRFWRPPAEHMDLDFSHGFHVGDFRIHNNLWGGWVAGSPRQERTPVSRFPCSLIQGPTLNQSVHSWQD